MGRFKVLIYFFFLFLTGSLVAQPVDTVSFRIIPDIASTYKIRCQALKVDTSTTPITFANFTLADTIGGAYTFTWSGDALPVENGIPRAAHEFVAPGSYEIILSVFENTTGKTYLAIDTANIQERIVVPNVFTPNGDDDNDLFIVRANGITPLHISIYSRSGTLIHEAKSPIIIWDGRSASGSLVSQGIYYYILTSDDPGVQPRKGFFYIFDPQE